MKAVFRVVTRLARQQDQCSSCGQRKKADCSIGLQSAFLKNILLLSTLLAHKARIPRWFLGSIPRWPPETFLTSFPRHASPVLGTPPPGVKSFFEKGAGKTFCVPIHKKFFPQKKSPYIKKLRLRCESPRCGWRRRPPSAPRRASGERGWCREFPPTLPQAPCRARTRRSAR